MCTRDSHEETTSTRSAILEEVGFLKSIETTKIAQLVEQWRGESLVNGSNPTQAIIHSHNLS